MMPFDAAATPPGTTPRQYVATARFGYGAVPGQPLLEAGSMLGQVMCRDPNLISPLPTAAKALAHLHTFCISPTGSPAASAAGQAIFAHGQVEAQAYLSGLVTAALPVRERVVAFFANHFALMAFSFPMFCTAGGFVREAIRPYIGGTFAQMAQAVISHPAMIYSLNVDVSVAASSQRGVSAARRGVLLGINENLGREFLELHTVTPAAGYVQADVDGMANLFAGFKVTLSSSGGSVAYDPDCVSPGSQTVLGVSYPCTLAGCQAAVSALASSPFAYANLAWKLLREFVSDAPSPADVASVQAALQSSGGSIVEAMRAVMAVPDSFSPMTKVRNPLDFVVAALRAVGTSASSMPNIDPTLGFLGMPLWQPPFPNGWSCASADWLSAAGMAMRVNFACAFAASLASPPDAVNLAVDMFGPYASASTMAAIGSAGTPALAFAAFLCSPEFQRR